MNAVTAERTAYLSYRDEVCEVAPAADEAFERPTGAPRVRATAPPRRIAATSLAVAAPFDLADQFCAYLAHIGEDAGVSPRHAGAVRELWRVLTEAVPGIKVPAAGPGGELGFYFSWNYKDIYVGVDIAPDGRFEWFAKDPVTGESWASGEDEILHTPPDALLSVLTRRCLR